MNLAVIGMQFGDEGKGKIVDYLAENFDIVARFSGGSNAGHTVVFDGKTVKFHLVPSGVLCGKIGVLGSGMAVDLERLVEEIELLRNLGVDPKIIVSSRAHVVTELHRMMDERDDEIIGIGTTRRGIGPTYVSKYRRVGIRVADLFNRDVAERKLEMIAKLNHLTFTSSEIAKEAKKLETLAEKIRGMVEDVEVYLNREINEGKSVLFEGSQGTFLDVDFGTYPYVTSSSTTVGGIVTGLGVPPGAIHGVLGVAKAYTTRVGRGPFPTEIDDEEAETLRELGGEYGATTGRARRIGYLDLVLLRYARMVNGIEEIALTKIDVVSKWKEIRVAVEYECNGKSYRYPPPRIEKCKPRYISVERWSSIEDEEFEKFIELLEKEVGARVKIISYGPDRESTSLR